MGKYVPTAQPLVPRTEAPLRDLRSPRGWRIVVSAFLHHDSENEGEAGVRLRFFDSVDAQRAVDDVLAHLEEVEIGHLFGGTDEILAITSEEEHAYNVETEIWLLPGRGKPERLLWIRGVLENFASGGEGGVPGVTVARQTYDGEHAETKGTVEEFYAWDHDTRSLKLKSR